MGLHLDSAAAAHGLADPALLGGRGGYGGIVTLGKGLGEGQKEGRVDAVVVGNEDFHTLKVFE